MGGELAQEGEWSEAREVDWWLLDRPEHRGVQAAVRDLNRVYREQAALWSLDSNPDGFRWIDADDACRNVYSFLRFGSDGSRLACVANFSPVPRDDFRLGLPARGRWTELINTDAEAYGGSGVGNFGVVTADGEPWQGQPTSATLRLPPLGTLWLRYEG
jgi:1,4-alpha-glucan branching enzyme